jgi:hypothetical protein
MLGRRAFERELNPPLFGASPMTSSAALEKELLAVLSQGQGWSPSSESPESLQDRALRAFEQAAQAPPCADLAESLLLFAQHPFSLRLDDEIRQIALPLAQAFANACRQQMDAKQLMDARERFAMKIIGPGSFELGQALVAKLQEAGPLDPSTDWWRLMLFDSIHDYGRQEARAMSALLCQALPGSVPDDFLDLVSREGSCDILLGCLESMPWLLRDPSLPLIFDRYLDEDGFDKDAPQPAIDAFDEAMSMGMDPTTCPASAFRIAELASRVEAAALSGVARAPGAKTSRASL